MKQRRLKLRPAEVDETDSADDSLEDFISAHSTGTSSTESRDGAIHDDGYLPTSRDRDFKMGKIEDGEEEAAGLRRSTRERLPESFYQRYGLVSGLVRFGSEDIPDGELESETETESETELDDDSAENRTRDVQGRDESNEKKRDSIALQSASATDAYPGISMPSASKSTSTSPSFTAWQSDFAHHSNTNGPPGTPSTAPIFPHYHSSPASA